jgi:Phage-related minor tail protein
VAISEEIEVNAGEAISAVGKLAAAFDDAADKALGAVDKINSALDGLGRGTAAAASGPDKLAASMDSAAERITAAADKAAESMAKIGGAADAASGGVGKLGDSADAAAGGLRDASASADEFAAASDRIAEGSDAAAAGLDRQAAAADRAAGSSDAAKDSSAGFGSTAKMALLGVAVAAGYGIEKAAKFQSEMLLLHTQAGVSAKDTATMSQGVLKISAQTGQSLSDVAASAYHVASNMESMKGASPVKMLQAVKIAAEGATVGHSDLVSTTNALTSVLASGIPGAKNYTQAMGALNATVGSGDMSMQDLSEAMGTGVVPVVKGYGLTLKDTGAALATYGDLNIRGAKAGTELRMAVQALAVPAAAGAGELKKLGLTSGSLAQDMQSGGLMKALDDLNGKFEKNGITAKNEGQVITELFGKKAGSGLALLLENMDRMQSKYPALTKGANDFGAAWKATQASPAQEWKEIGTGLEASAVNFGTTLLPAFTKAAGFADKILNDVSGSKGAAEGLAVAFGGAVALATGKKLFTGVESSISTIGKIGETLKIPGLDKLSDVGKGSAAAGMQTAADTNVTAADRMGIAADTFAEAASKMSTPGVIPGVGGGKGEPAAAETDVTEASEGILSASALKTLMKNGLGKAGGALLIEVIGQSVADAIPQHKGDHVAAAAKKGVQFGTDVAAGAQFGSMFGPEGTVAGAVAGALGGLWQVAPANMWSNASKKTAAFDQDKYNLNSAQMNFGTGQQQMTAALAKAVPTSLAKLISDQFAAALPTLGPHSKVTAEAQNAMMTDFAAQGLSKSQASSLISVFAQGIREYGSTQQDKQNASNTFSSDTAGARQTQQQKAEAPFTSTLAQAMGKGAKVPPMDLSAVNADKGKAADIGKSFTAALTAAMGKPVKVPPLDLSGLAADQGKAQALGAGVDTGLAAGIRGNEAVAVAAASQAAAAVAAAMSGPHGLDSHSPSKVTEKIGKDAVSGLVLGLEGGKGSVGDAASALSKAATAPWANGTTTATYKTLMADVASAFKDHTISASQDSAAVAFLKSDTAKMQSLEHQRSTIEASIKAADAYASNVQSSAISNASIVNVAGNITSADNSTSAPTPAASYQSSDLISGAQGQLQQTKQFNSAIATDKKMGLNTTELGQIIQSGAQTGLPIAQAIASGGKGAVSQLNALQSQMNAAAKQLGVTSGNAMYESGSQIGQGLAAGLKGELGSVVSSINHLATQMVDEMKKELKISSPSQVFADLAEMVPAGAAMGVERGTPMAASAVGRMGSAMAGGYRPSIGAYHGGGYGGGSGGSGGGGNVTYHTDVHVTIQGSVTTENDLLTKLQGIQLQRSANNWQAGWNLPGRAA